MARIVFDPMLLEESKKFRLEIHLLVMFSLARYIGERSGGSTAPTGRACNFRPAPGFRPPRRDAANSTLGYFRGSLRERKCRNSSRNRAVRDLVSLPRSSFRQVEIEHLLVAGNHEQD